MSAIETEPHVAVSEPDIGGRGRIQREARTLFVGQGFAAVSMQQIADAAAVNKATLYHHFKDKEALFVTVMAEELARMSAGMAASVAEGGSLRDQLQRVATHILAARHSDFGRLLADLRVHVSAERRDHLMTGRPAPWEPIRIVVERAMATGEARGVDPELAARAFFAMVGSQIWWSKFDSGRVEADDRLAVTLVDLLIEGIGGERHDEQPFSTGDHSPLITG